MSARPSPSEAALRRLELLSAELAEVRPREVDREVDHGTDHGTDHGVVVDGDKVELAPVLPLPGRHAARLPAPEPRWRLPDGLALRPAHLAGLALIVAAGLLVATWW